MFAPRLLAIAKRLDRLESHCEATGGHENHCETTARRENYCKTTAQATVTYSLVYADYVAKQSVSMFNPAVTLLAPSK